jgi:hypothetical protein
VAHAIQEINRMVRLTGGHLAWNPNWYAQ